MSENTEVSLVETQNKTAWNKRARAIFKWLFVLIPFMPLICIGIRVMRLIRQLLTLRGVALMASILMLWNVLPDLRIYLSGNDPFKFIPNHLTIFEYKFIIHEEYKIILLLGLIVWVVSKILPPSRQTLRHRLAITEAKIENLVLHPLSIYRDNAQGRKLRRLKNKRDKIKLRIKFS